jgi:preprotein translocase subunit SecB
MNPSPLLLDSYYFKEITIKYHSGTENSGDKIVADDLKVNVLEMQDDDNSRKWIFQLTIELPETAKPKSPYTFRIILTGFFEVSETYQAALADKLAKANGPAILYSAAREILAILTARGFGSTLLLPSVNFLPPAQKKTEEEKAVAKPQTKSVKRVRKTTKKKTIGT